MRVAVTGTPGTGKSTATAILEERLRERFDGTEETDEVEEPIRYGDETGARNYVEAGGESNESETAPRKSGVRSGDTSFEVIHLNEVLETEGFYTGVDEERKSLVADIEAIDEWLTDRDAEVIVFESHFAHRFEADSVAVLRCHPAELKARLADRGTPESKVMENAESEALDVILAEAVENHSSDSVYEIDTTEQKPREVAEALLSVLTGERTPSAGEVDFLDYIDSDIH